MSFRALDHVAITSSDSRVSREWYERVLGMEWVHQGRWNNNPVFLEKGSARIAIFQESADKPERATTGDAGQDANPAKEQRPGVRIDHFAFLAETMADFESVKTSLTGLGVPFSERNFDIALSIYVYDPDNHKVEITTYDI